MIALVSVTLNMGEAEDSWAHLLVEVPVPEELAMDTDVNEWASAQALLNIKPFLNNRTHYFTSGAALL